MGRGGKRQGAGRNPGIRKSSKRQQCKHTEWKDGKLTRCEKLAAPQQVFCCRAHAPYGMYAIDEACLPKKSVA